MVSNTHTCGMPELALDLTQSFISISCVVLVPVQALAERYTEQGDALSAILLLESSITEFAGALPKKDSVLLAAARQQVSDLMYSLSPVEARSVMTKRQGGGNGRTGAFGSSSSSGVSTLLRSLARDFTEPLGSYASGKRSAMLDGWVKGQPLPPVM